MTEPSFLFETTAPYYSRFRPGYPDELFRHVVQQFGLNGRGRLLDLGCGTGQRIVRLAPHSADAVGMDPEVEMLDEAGNFARATSITNIRWLKGDSTDRRAGHWLLFFNILLLAKTLGRRQGSV